MENHVAIPHGAVEAVRIGNISEHDLHGVAGRHFFEPPPHAQCIVMDQCTDARARIDKLLD